MNENTNNEAKKEEELEKEIEEAKVFGPPIIKAKMKIRDYLAKIAREEQFSVGSRFPLSGELAWNEFTKRCHRQGISVAQGLLFLIKKDNRRQKILIRISEKIDFDSLEFENLIETTIDSTLEKMDFSVFKKLSKEFESKIEKNCEEIVKVM